MLGASREYIWKKVGEQFPPVDYGAITDQIAEEVFQSSLFREHAIFLLKGLGHNISDSDELEDEGNEELMDQDLVGLCEQGLLDNKIQAAILFIVSYLKGGQ